MSSHPTQLPAAGSSGGHARQSTSGSRETEGDDYDDEGFLNALATMPLTPAVATSAKRGNGETSADAPAAGGDDEVLPSTQWNLADIFPDVEAGPPASKKRKVARFASLQEDVPDGAVEEHTPPDDGKGQAAADSASYLASSAYEAIRFGEFSKYMRNKRAKLKVQEESLKEQEEALLRAVHSSRQVGEAAEQKGPTAPIAAPPQLFQGCTIYITGHTNPPYAEMRRLIVLHGGDFMAYLDQKSPVTHIIASNLTPKKRIEFQAYRVVKPEWVTESIKAGKRLPWSEFKVESDAGGAMGVERLPSGRAAATAANKPGGGFLVDAFSGKAATSAAAFPSHFAGGSRPDLANANPWGRASAQKKLTGFAPTKTSASGKIPPAAPRDTPNVASTAAEPVPSREPEPRQQSPARATGPPQPQPQPTSSQLTAEEEQWLGSLETPPKDKGKARQDEDFAAGSASESPSKGNVIGELPPLFSPRTPTHQKNSFTSTTTTPSKDRESAVGTDPVTRAAAEAAGQLNSGHPYAKRPSNTHAAKLLASPSWREENTATSESFLSGFFAKSRLHYLSTWKGELRDLVSQALKDAGREEGSQTLPQGTARVIMHVDFDSFFVSVGLRDRPDLIDQPVVVCHAGSSEGGGNAGVSSTSEIASCNYVARKFGVHNGWSLGRARQVCPKVQTIPYDFEAYKDISIDFYSLMLLHADAIEAVSVDEALIDVSMLLRSMRSGSAGGNDDDTEGERAALISAYRHHTSSQGEQWTEEKQLAEALRDEIRRRTRCEASIGIGSNTLLARLATRHAKPGGSFHLKDADVPAFVDNLEIDELQGVGYSTRQRFQNVFGTANVGQLKRVASQSRFMSELGPKLGKQVWDKMHGLDRAELEGAKQRQSVGAAVNYGIRFENQAEAEKFVNNLAQEVSNRLSKHQLRGKQANVTVMVRDPAAPVEAPKFLGHGICDVHNRSSAISGPGGVATNDVQAIFRAAWRLVRGLNADPKDLRGIAISCTKLEPVSGAYQRVMRPRPKGGQSLLSFQPSPKNDRIAPATPSSKLSLPPIEAEDAEESDDSGGEELQAGPLSSLPRRPPGSQRITRLSVSPTRNLPTKEALGDSPASIPHARQSSSGSTSQSQRAHSAEPAVAAAADAPILQRSLDVLPTMSQLDQSVLKELPPSIRAEVLRESKRLSKVGGSTTAAMTRSLSASPSAPRRIDKGSLTSFFAGRRGDGTAAVPAAAPLPSRPRPPPLPTTKFDAVPASSPGRRGEKKPNNPPIAARNPPFVVDPSTITAEDLRALDIDPDVFSALPLTVQRETLMHQSRVKQGREARSIIGQHKGEKRLAEERRDATNKAAISALGGDGGGLDMDVQERSQHLYRARRSDDATSELPSIQKRQTTSEVQALLTRWISSHRGQKPRTNDVSRFSTYLTESLSVDGRLGSAHCDLEKVHELLTWWQLELDRVLGGVDAQDDHADAAAAAAAGSSAAMAKARRGWKEAFERVKGDVDRAIKRRFGGDGGSSRGSNVRLRLWR